LGVALRAIGYMESLFDKGHWTNWRVVVSCLAWPTARRRQRSARPTITVMSMRPSAAIRCADAPHAMTGCWSSSRFYRARTTASGSAIRHDRQRRHVQLSEPAPLHGVDGDLSPYGIPVPLAVVARGANPMPGEDFRPVAWNFCPPPSSASRYFRAGKSGGCFQRP
jgi:hypothetical protein